MRNLKTKGLIKNKKVDKYIHKISISKWIKNNNTTQILKKSLY